MPGIPGTKTLPSRTVRVGSGSTEYYRQANIIEGVIRPPSNQRNPNFAYATPFGKARYRANPLPKKIMEAQRTVVPANILVQTELGEMVPRTVARTVGPPAPRPPTKSAILGTKRKGRGKGRRTLEQEAFERSFKEREERGEFLAK